MLFRPEKPTAHAEKNSTAAPVTRPATPTAPDRATIASFTAAVLGARDGQRLAARAPTAALQRISGTVLPAAAVFMLVDAVM
ncbi:hypothetical protein ACFRCI_27210 [Streptomyces sp. NPDC056638]|uniref:hypothetical protein n=1 Tax=Streptomyces sp. NPDC056638 TaxID=3345887 RepID=UPI0036C3370E